MNNNIKISVTIQGIGGRTRHTTGVKKVFFDYIKKSKSGKEFVKKGHRIISEDVWVPASKHINMTQDAYDYMTSNECPSWFKGKWKKLSTKERLEEHLKRTMLAEGGSSFTYNILND